MSHAELELPASNTSEDDLPEGWIEVPLDALLVSLETGSRPSGGVRGIADGIPSIGGEHLNDDGRFRFENVKYVPEAFFNRMSRGHIQQGDVLVVKDGATTGKVSYVDDTFPYSSAVVNEHVFICRVAPDVDSQFVFRFLHSEEGQRRILENFRGSAQGGINQGFAPNTAIPLPPLAEQRRIVAKLEQVLAAARASRERLARVPALMKRFRQSVLAAACSGRLTAEWREQNPNAEPASLLLERILAERRARWEAEQIAKKRGKSPTLGLDMEMTLTAQEKAKYQEPAAPDTSDLPELPEQWCWASTEQIVSVGTGATPLRKDATFYSGGTIPWVTSSAVNRLFVAAAEEHITQKALQETNVKVFPVGTLLVAMYGEGQTRGKVSELVIAAATNQACAALIFSEETMCYKPYIKLFYQKNYEDVRILSAGGVQPNLNLSIIKNTAIPFPPLAEQQEIVRRVEALLKFADAVERRTAAAAARADRLVQAVLAKAFRGELVPTEAELARAEGRDYEPASALLAHIRAERAATPGGRPARNGRKPHAGAVPAQEALALTDS